ncbi:hypothetical protein LUQ84_001625 [Hamiltosporidium tvaerminnensis]|nr:hypothetical protein LUQ84_001625 [Hamiltosporidium tvaerminnensis]
MFNYEKLLENHKFERNEDSITIELNIPEDFIYEISSINVIFTNCEVKLLCDEIPENIKENIYRFYKNDVFLFITFLEENLEVFLSGKIPKIDYNSQINTNNSNMSNIKENRNENIKNICKPAILLPDDYFYPINDIKSFNISYKADKKNIALLLAEKLNIKVLCNNCKKHYNIHSRLICDKCNEMLIYEYFSTLSDQFFGFIKLENCTFIAFNYNSYVINCLTCSKIYRTTEIGINTQFEFKCCGCYSFISLTLKDIQYKTYQKSLSSKIKVGVPLPENGTCIHYRKSFRWFRFPCCNKLFPCDICHDKETDHCNEMANKMVCGFCSKEQSVKNNCECGMTMKKSTAHWEGGKGTRNKVVMSKKDNKKYKK